MKDYIEERAINIANYIIESNATVRQTAREFGVSNGGMINSKRMERGYYYWGVLDIDKRMGV